MNDLIDIVRNEVMTNLLNKNSTIGRDLSTSMVSIWDVREVLYSTLMDIELREVKKKWGKE